MVSSFTMAITSLPASESGNAVACCSLFFLLHARPSTAAAAITSAARTIYFIGDILWDWEFAMITEPATPRNRGKRSHGGRTLAVLENALARTRVRERAHRAAWRHRLAHALAEADH